MPEPIVRLKVVVSDPWELGELSFVLTVPEHDLLAAAFPGDELVVRLEPGGEILIGGVLATGISVSARHVDESLARASVGDMVNVSGMATAEDGSKQGFLGSIEPADSGS